MKYNIKITVTAIGCCLVWCCFTGCHENRNSQTDSRDSTQKATLPAVKKDTPVHVRNKKEDSIGALIDSRINDLYEVKQLRKKTKYPVISLSRDEEDDTARARRYYYVQVGVSDSFRFTPVFNFYISKTDLSINYLSTIEDTIIPLKFWRAHKKEW